MDIDDFPDPTLIQRIDPLVTDPPINIADPNRFDGPALNPADDALRRAFYRELELGQVMEICTTCNERWFEMGLVNGVCRRCQRDKSIPAKFSAANEMDPGKVPVYLPKLSQVEEMLIARVHTYTDVRQIRGEQYRYSGNVVNFHRNTQKVVDRLPLLPSQVEILLLKPSNTNSDNRLQRQFSRDHRVRRGHIQTWLIHLKANHSGYRDIVIDEAALAQLPVDEDVSN